VSAGREPAPLIVGYDGSTPAHAALAWAARSGEPIVVVRVLTPSPAAGAAAEDPAAVVLGAHRRAASSLLTDCAWCAEPVEAPSPASGLADAARRHGARAIVVGSHGHGHRRAVIGSEPHQLLAIADVPVIIVPPQAGARLLHDAA
jgi:nucleotide-binding universal stress UspA family protein